MGHTNNSNLNSDQFTPVLGISRNTGRRPLMSHFDSKQCRLEIKTYLLFFNHCIYVHFKA